MSSRTPAFAGHSYRVTIDNGTVFHNTYAPDGSTLHYKVVEGPTKGFAETVRLHVAEVAADMYYVNWVEASGTTVSHVMDHGRGTVHAFWTYPDDTAPVAARTGELHTAALSLLGS